MYSNIPLWLSVFFIAAGLCLLTWSANRFVDGADAIARSFGISPFVIGMVIIGFGTSAPELAVSVLSAFSGHSDLSLGNAYGSNIFNIAVILGLVALVKPIAVKSITVFAAVPMLIAVTVISGLLVFSGKDFTRIDGLVSLAAFGILLPLYCHIEKKSGQSSSEPSGAEDTVPQLRHPWFTVILGLVLLVASSHFLVWGAVDFARAIGVSELLIGVTIVAAGTSLPELASAIASARKGKHEFVLGNIIGSNVFNALIVVGASGLIAPFGNIPSGILYRDFPAMLILTLLIGIFGVNLKKPSATGKIGRIGGLVWILAYVAYCALLLNQEYVQN